MTSEVQASLADQFNAGINRVATRSEQIQNCIDWNQARFEGMSRVYELAIHNGDHLGAVEATRNIRRYEANILALQHQL